MYICISPLALHSRTRFCFLSSFKKIKDRRGNESNTSVSNLNFLKLKIIYGYRKIVSIVLKNTARIEVAKFFFCQSQENYRLVQDESVRATM